MFFYIMAALNRVLNPISRYRPDHTADRADCGTRIILGESSNPSECSLCLIIKMAGNFCLCLECQLGLFPPMPFITGLECLRQ